MIINLVIMGFVIFIYDISIDNYYNFCNYYAYFLLLIHHILSVIMQFGWLNNSKTFLYNYLIATFIIFLGLLIYKMCILTLIVNKNCNIQKNKRFRDLLFILNIPKRNIIILRLIISIFVIYKINYLL